MQTPPMTPGSRKLPVGLVRRLGQVLPGLAAFAAALGCLAAGPGDYLIDTWTGDHGLPSSSVTAIAQTPDGYLWVGTYNGLVRLDGVRFVTFDPSNTPELQHARIRHLDVDAAGTLWISTFYGSLTSYRDGQFRAEWTGEGVADSAVTAVSLRSNAPVFLLRTGALLRRVATNSPAGPWQVLKAPGARLGEMCAQDAEGVIWCRGRDRKVWRLLGDRFDEVALANSGLGADLESINCLVTGSDGRLWVGMRRGLAFWDGARFVSATPTNGEPTVDARFLYPTPDGSVWVVADQRVRKARARQWIFEAEPCRGVFNGGWDRMGIQQDALGGIWLYHYGKGLFHIRPDGRTRQLADEEDFPGERVDCFFEDREGNLWAGVDRGGLVRVREKRFAVLAPNAGARASKVVSVAEDAQGALWLGTYGGGLYRYQSDTWEAVPLPESAPSGFVFSVCPDHSGRLWLSAGEENIFWGLGNQIETVPGALHGVKVILAAHDDRIWLGTKNGLGCWEEGKFRRLTPEEGVPSVDVRALVEDRHGVVWAGADNGALYRIETKRVTAFTPEDALKSQPVWSLLTDAEDSVWVGTFRGGLLHFQAGRFVRYTTRNGLPSDVICQLLDDEQGRLWIGSQQGISCVAKAELLSLAGGKDKTVNCTTYGRYDGLPSLECSGGYQPAACRTRDGRLLFATLKGAVLVRPQELLPNRLPPPVVLEEVLVEGITQPLARRSGENSAAPPAWLKIPPGRGQIEFRFAGLSFVSPDRVRFRYRLNPLNKDWVEAGTRRSAHYDILGPGEYLFEVIACNNGGVWNERPATLAFQVLPHYYQTWWFLTLAGAAAIVSTAGTVRHFATKRMRFALARAERQRAIEQDRARIAKDIHDDLGAGLTHITLLSELAQREPGSGAPARLDQIADTARELTLAMDEIVWAVSPENDSLDSLLTYISRFSQHYLQTAGIACRLDLPPQLPVCALSSEVRHNLFLAVKETLTNVIKHAGATEVWLRLALSAGTATLSIQDNGCGLAASGQAASAARPARISTGHGLQNLEKRLAASGGHCVVTSEPGKGTRVELTARIEL